MTADDRVVENPDLWSPHDVEQYEEFTPASVYYDDVAKSIAAKMAEHNRIVLVLQGLLDRSPVFHPHPPWKLWTDDFARALKPVLDSDRTLSVGATPDFVAYRAALNKSLKRGSVVIGQMDAWLRAEGKKENDRRARSWRRSNNDRECVTYHPYGNPGPGVLAKIARLSRDGKTATFEWTRERQRYATGWNARGKPGEPLPCSFSCPTELLFNVDAYTAGDFHRFYDDPRTRADYLEWAPFLLRAEDYKAGKRKLGGKEEL